MRFIALGGTGRIRTKDLLIENKGAQEKGVCFGISTLGEVEMCQFIEYYCLDR
jgi:hypothetical protein